MYQAYFTMDCHQATYPGYTDGHTWNGWERPYFDWETACKILENSQRNGIGWEYRESTNTFWIWYNDDPNDSEYVSAILINGLELFAIGSGSWIWEIFNEDYSI